MFSIAHPDEMLKIGTVMAKHLNLARNRSAGLFPLLVTRLYILLVHNLSGGSTRDLSGRMQIIDSTWLSQEYRPFRSRRRSLRKYLSASKQQ
jgi:hypothetical protein